MCKCVCVSEFMGECTFARATAHVRIYIAVCVEGRRCQCICVSALACIRIPVQEYE